MIGTTWALVFITGLIAGSIAAAAFWRARRDAWGCALLADSDELVAVANRSGIRQFVSSSYERVLGYRPADLIGRSVLELVHPEDLPAASAALESCQRSGSQRWLRLRIQHANGAWRTFSIHARSYLSDRHVRGIVVTARDEAGFRQLQYALQQAQRMEGIGGRACSIAHDMNNLLTVVIGNLSRDAARDDIDAASDAAKRAATLSRQLLMFAHGQAVARTRANLNSLVLDLEPILCRVSGYDTEVRLQLEPDLWNVQANSSEVEQVLLNLVVNAGEAMPDGGLVEIRTQNVTLADDVKQRAGLVRRGDYVCVEVQDTGTGMDDVVLRQIFEPLFTTKRASSGSGFGLATVARIMRSHSGHVAVSSTPGEGTTFTLCFPRVS